MCHRVLNMVRHNLSVMCREGERPLSDKSCIITSPCEEKTRKTNKTMAGQCHERHGVEGVKEDALRDWVSTIRALQVDPGGNMTSEEESECVTAYTILRTSYVLTNLT